jgi:hypothetical protein
VVIYGDAERYTANSEEYMYRCTVQVKYIWQDERTESEEIMNCERTLANAIKEHKLNRVNLGE